MHELSYFREHLELFAEMATRRNITLELDGFREFARECASSIEDALSCLFKSRTK